MNPDIYIDPLTNDIALIRGELKLIENEAQLIRQKLNITLNTFRGEWFFNTLYGIPYLENDNNDIAALSKTSLNVLNYEVRRAILDTEGVRALSGYTSEFDRRTRTVNISFSAILESGEVLNLDSVPLSVGGS